MNTNTVESWFALLKRGVYGNFHYISDKRLDRFVDEFVFRWDSRKITDTESTRNAINSVHGKRLM